MTDESLKENENRHQETRGQKQQIAITTILNIIANIPQHDNWAPRTEFHDAEETPMMMKKKIICKTNNNNRNANNEQFFDFD